MSQDTDQGNEFWQAEIAALVASGTVPHLPDESIRAACRAAIALGRVGKHRADPADIARILIEHGVYSLSAGGLDAVDAQINAMPSVIAARAAYEQDDAPLYDRLQATGIDERRLQALDRAMEHGWQGRPSADEERAYGINLSRVALAGRLWRAEEQARIAWQQVNSARIQAIALEEAVAFLATREAAHV